MKYWKLAMVSILMMFILTGCGESKAEKLAAFGEEQFVQNDLEAYIEGLKSCGLSDLSAEVSTSYDYEYDYDKESKTLHLSCAVSNFISDEIDQYYTTDYNGKDAQKLANILITLKNLRDDTATSYTYTMESGEKVIVKIGGGFSKAIHVKTSEGRDYEYSYYVDYDDIMIDGDYVYMEEARNDYQASTSSGTSSSGSSTTVTDDDELGVCWALAKDVVKSNLKSPSSAKFPFSYGSDGVSITKSGDTYTVKAWVEAENSFGATLRSDFTVTMTKSGSGKNAKFTAQSCYIDE